MVQEVISSLLTVQNMFFMSVGVAAGTVIGALPGLTATMGVEILLPLTFGMDSITGMVMLLGIYCGGIYGGSITAILIKTPGTPASAATAIEGYPLAQAGRGGDALYTALFSSMIGGLFSCFALLFFAPLIAGAALKFGSPEYTALAFFGLTVISVATSKNAIKGLSMSAIGLLITMIGFDPIEGVTRFTFRSVSLRSGIALVPAMLGAFALTELFEKVRKIHRPEGSVQVFKKRSITNKEILRHWQSLIKGSVIGTFIGAVPGTGAAIASFLSYNEAKRASKNKEEFGNGSIDGIVASESANNGVTGATLIPLLTLGIPGDAVTAILLGALMMQGITPGPQLFTDGSFWVYSIMGSLILINLIMFFEGIFFCRFFVNVTRIPQKLLVSLLLVLCVVGSFAVNNSVADVWVMIVFGVLCYGLSKLDYPMTPLVISLVLGGLFETNLRQSLILSKGSFMIFFSRPIALVFLLISFAMLVLSIVKTIRETLDIKTDEQIEA